MDNLGAASGVIEDVLVAVAAATGRLRGPRRAAVIARLVVRDVGGAGADPVQPQRGQRVNVDEHGEEEQETAHGGAASGTGGGTGDGATAVTLAAATASEYPGPPETEGIARRRRSDGVERRGRPPLQCPIDGRGGEHAAPRTDANP